MDYESLLRRAREKLPDSVLKTERFSIPKIRGHIQGNKTVLSNLYQIADILGTDFDHFLKYILKELATPVEIRKPLIILGRKIGASRINDKVKEYAHKFIICKECGKPDTSFVRQNRILFIKCNACGAKYPSH
ncbi:translation initiation factor IF-2 subunit beta [Candidatus Woesearchaeota archaeon]|nr:translation initiation factor IF-2 subunit beta [Candidatus Woesearchaeota archaeon]